MIEGVIYTALHGLVSNRVHPSKLPQEPDGPIIVPAIRYTIVSSEPFEDLCGTDDGETDDTRVQIDCVAKTHGAMLTLRDQVRNAMMSLDPPARRQGGFQTYDFETETHRAVEDYLFQASSS